jgi:hypothetical protein
MFRSGNAHFGKSLESVLPDFIQAAVIIVGLKLVKSFFKICDRIHCGEW